MVDETPMHTEPKKTAATPEATPEATTAAAPESSSVQPAQSDSPEPAAASAANTGEPTADAASLQRQLDEANQKVAEHWDALLRQQAEMENLRKRNQRELENARKYALEKFATELLAVKDSMELGLEAAAQADTDLKAVHEGMSLTLKMFSGVLEKFDVQEIAPHGQKFDPQYHEAMAMQPTPDAEEGTVLIVHQKGYQLNERLIRPARVIVAKAMPEPTSASDGAAGS